jgi:uncharacterized protein
MNGEKNLEKLLKTMKPKLNLGEFVFCTVHNVENIDLKEVVMTFREEESISIIVSKEIADQFGLPYTFVASWITLTVHSSLEAIGLTAAFSKALAENSISCNVVAGFYHDHIFVDKKDSQKAMEILHKFSE